MEKLPVIDMAVIGGYLALMLALGLSFSRKSFRPNQFMTAGGSQPGWILGLSIFGTYAGGTTFLTNPAQAYEFNWNWFAFTLSLPIAAWIALRFFVPYYRRFGEASAYEHLEQRFGTWARLYATLCYLVVQIVRAGALLMLVAVALSPLTGWKASEIVLLTGALVTAYTLFGGVRAVIWTAMMQSVVFTAAVVTCIVLLFYALPGGPKDVFATAGPHKKFSLGSFDLVHEVKAEPIVKGVDAAAEQTADRDRVRIGRYAINLVEPTFWLVLIFGLFENLRIFGIDQRYVQRYIAARSDGDARRAVWIGMLCYLPVSAGLFFIGTALFAFYASRPGMLPPGTLPHEVFPYFIAHEVPVGAKGLIIAAILAAGICSIDSSINSSATLVLCDIYRRFVRRSAGDWESMAVLYLSTLICGAITIAIATWLIPREGVLDGWWIVSGILSSGMLGLFLLGLISHRAGNVAAVTAVVIGVLTIAWLALSELSGKVLEPFATSMPRFHQAAMDFVTSFAPYRSFLHPYLTLPLGTLTILLVGILMSRFAARDSRT